MQTIFCYFVSVMTAAHKQVRLRKKQMMFIIFDLRREELYRFLQEFRDGFLSCAIVDGLACEIRFF